MPNILENYDYIVLDFSSMFVKLDSDLVQSLNSGTNILVPSTFDYECMHIQRVVPDRIANTFKENIGNISKSIMKTCEQYGTIDTFSLAFCLSQGSCSVLVIEANNALEDKLILTGLGIDIYSLLEDKLIKQEDFSALSTKKLIHKSKTPLKYCEVKSGDSVYTDTIPYVLADPFDGGAEARIYKVKNNPKLLAKIFKEENGNFVLTSEKLNNINILKEVNDNWDVLWLALPTAIIYADSALKKPVGYLMNYFNETKFLSHNSLFTGGDISAKFPEHDETCIKDVLDICIKFVRQILFLTLNDIYLTDYNDKNFAVPIKNDSKIVMVDTDSYCCEGFVSECMTYTSRKNVLNDRLDLIEHCDESLFSFIFTRLVLDSGFGPMRKSEFRFSASKMIKLDNPNFKAKWISIPQNLQELFIDIYDKKFPPSISVLLYELEVASKQSFAYTKYKDIYKDVLEIGTKKPEPEPEPVKSFPSQLPPPQKRKSWIAKLVKMSFAIVIGLTLWWFVLGHPGWTTFANLLAELPGMTTAIKNVTYQLPRHETDVGYYQSLSTELNGYVEYYWDNGDVYKGNFTNGLTSGQGVRTYANGETYSGDFVDGQMSGIGIYSYPDGTKYQGNFENNIRNGQGILYNNVGNVVYTGNWKNGLFDGEGTYSFPNNVVLVNTWVNGTYNGTDNAEEPFYFTYTSNGQLFAIGYWSENIFYGNYYENDQEYKLP